MMSSTREKKVLIGNVIYLLSFFCLFGGGFIDNYGYVLLALYLVYSFCIFPNETIYAFSNKVMMPLYVFLIYYLVSSNFNIKNVMSLFGRLSPIPIAIFQFKLLFNFPELIRIQKVTIFICMLMIMGFSIFGLFLLSVNPMAMRALVSTDVDNSIIVGGGFGLPYSLSLLLPVLFPVVLSLIHRKQYLNMETIFMVSFIIIGLLLIFRAQYMTAVLLFFVGVFFMLISRFSKLDRIILFFIGVIACSYLYVYLPDIFGLMGVEDDSMLSARFDEISSLTSGESHDAKDFLIRMDHIYSTLNIFLENKLFGVGPNFGYNFEKMRDFGVGMHAEWFDILAIYGCSALLLYVFFIQTIKLRINKGNVSVIIFIILGFLNPFLQFQIIYATFYLAPMICFFNNRK